MKKMPRQKLEPGGGVRARLLVSLCKKTKKMPIEELRALAKKFVPLFGTDFRLTLEEIEDLLRKAEGANGMVDLYALFDLVKAKVCVVYRESKKAVFSDTTPTKRN